MPEVLDPLRVPLHGSHLIEASAGTGKTWTIAGLYLRLVLGHGDEGAAFARPLLPAEILVMTFTVAATRELSDRIRARLVEAARCFRGEQAPPPADTFLPALMAGYEAGAAREAAAWRLAMAAESMDDAAVYTIDAWCQRMLREHAFDSGSLFDEELLADEFAFVDEAARDYWRRNVYPLEGTALDPVIQAWPGGLGALIADVRALRQLDVGEVDVELSLHGVWERIDTARRARLAALKAGWVERAAEMLAWFQRGLAAKPGPFNRSMIQSARITGWCRALRAWAESPALVKPALTSTAWERFTPQGLQSASNAKMPIEIPEWSHRFSRLSSALEELPDAANAMRLHAAASVRRNVAELKRRAGTPGFLDMLQRLDAALGGPQGERLRARIVAQYPAALIDEFQDTSPLQYRIFDRIYRTSANDPQVALFLIGDPKQSIFGFRGADIRGYLGARTATAGRHHRLGTNHRSTTALVQAVNHLFASAEARPGEGAFLFGAAGGEGESPLPFVAVGARGRGERLRSAAGEWPALTFCHDGAHRSNADIRALFAGRCAEHIVALLDDAQAGFEDADGAFTRLCPADIAVLVRTGVEAQAVRHALRRRRVASVYLSDQDSVFASDQARDLVRWLQAVASPLDSRRVRAGLATPLIGLSLAELEVLARDDTAFEARVEQLRELKGVWQRQGVLPMLRQTLHLLGLPARWLGDADRERKLTNFLHLAELLQAATTQVEGEETLIRWLGQQIAEQAAEAKSVGEDHVVRLESDAGLVKVITVFKAKGLEYPLVYLPFGGAFRPARKERSFVAMPGDGDERRAVFEPTAEQLAAADHERLQEDMRLLYVALTRARHALWVGIAAHGGSADAPCELHRSALGHLLGASMPVTGDAIEPLLREASGGVDRVALVRGEEPATAALRPAAEAPPLGDALGYTARFESDWSIGSFSRLVRDLARSPLTPAPADPALAEELLVAPIELPAPRGDRAPRHRFPRGALPGNFLHDQLEWLAGSGFGLTADAELRERLRRRCDRLGWGHRAEDVVTWLSEVVATPLPALGVALDGLAGVRPEMEFWFPSQGLPARRIDALCTQHLLGGRPRPPIADRQLNGMVMGFADLVFEHGGRYWVLDYKSNALGLDDASYDHEALENAMAEHRYDVQAALYLLALHRLLRARLGVGYRPAQHLGGAIYLFLRGVRGPERGCYLVAAPPALLEALDCELGAAAQTPT